MLVLGRREGQQILVTIDGKELLLTINAIVGETVKIGIEGPMEFKVTRPDYKKKEKESK